MSQNSSSKVLICVELWCILLACDLREFSPGCPVLQLLVLYSRRCIPRFSVIARHRKGNGHSVQFEVNMAIIAM